MKILISGKDTEQVKQLKDIIKEVFGKEIESITLEKSYSKAIASLSKYKPVLFLFSYEDAQEDIEGKVGFPSSSIPFIGFGKKMTDAISIKKAKGLDFFSLPLDKDVIHLRLERWKKQNFTPKSLATKTSDGTPIDITISKIHYLEADNKHCHIYLKDSKKLTVISTLKHLMTLLPSEFVKVHKTFLVRESVIEHFFYEAGGRYMISLKDGTKIPVGRKFYKSVKVGLMGK